MDRNTFRLPVALLSAPRWASWRALPPEAALLHVTLCGDPAFRAGLTGIARPLLSRLADLVLPDSPLGMRDQWRRLDELANRCLVPAGLLATEGEWWWVCDLTEFEGVKGSALAKALAQAEELHEHCPGLAAAWMARYTPAGWNGVSLGGRPSGAAKPLVSEPPVMGEEPGVSALPEPGVSAAPPVPETGGFAHDNNAQVLRAASSSLRSEEAAASAGSPAPPAPEGAPPKSRKTKRQQVLVDPEQRALAERLLAAWRPTVGAAGGSAALASGIARTQLARPELSLPAIEAACAWGHAERPYWQGRMLDLRCWLTGADFVRLCADWAAAGSPPLERYADPRNDATLPGSAEGYPGAEAEEPYFDPLSEAMQSGAKVAELIDFRRGA